MLRKGNAEKWDSPDKLVKKVAKMWENVIGSYLQNSKKTCFEFRVLRNDTSKYHFISSLRVQKTRILFISTFTVHKRASNNAIINF